jgi:tRNA(Ile)-lysidine synthase
MLPHFLNFIRENNLFSSEDQILLAVSGGADSVVMTKLFHEAGLRFGIAHCNFALRGEESDDEQNFVRSLSDRLGVAFHSIRFDTLTKIRDEKISVQEAARVLRYEWFEELSLEHGYTKICTAHHSDDSIETFFINLLRGTGIGGLGGIPVKNGKVVRPMLFASKTDILEYARESATEFCEDSSNQSDKYLRNRIRHDLVPVLDELNPAFREILQREMHYFSDTRKVLEKALNDSKAICLEPQNENFILRFEKLRKLEPLPFYLYEFFKKFGFGIASARTIARMISGNPVPGKVFYSETHALHVERDSLLLRKNVPSEEPDAYLIEKAFAHFEAPFIFKTEIFPFDGNLKKGIKNSEAYLDLSKLSFPLVLRKWRMGDRFQPLGMNGTKLLSDYFTDEKFSKIMKENAWVLESAGSIVWLIGYRIDERSKIGAYTKEVFLITLG